MEKWIEIIIAMKQIYLINTRNRAASYGIGTYINQLITCLCQTASLYLTVVELDSDEKEVTLVKQDNIRYLKFPQISSFLYNTYTDRYNRNVAYLLSLFVDEKIGCIFHFNYLHHASLARCIKSRFPEASIILTIHYFNWCLLLKGNTLLFREIIYGEKDERNDFEQMIYMDFLQDKSFLNGVDKVICLSQYTYKLLNNEYKIPDSKIVSMVNGIRLPDTLLNEQECENEKRKMAFGKDEKVILFVGRLDEIKGVSLIIRVYQTGNGQGIFCSGRGWTEWKSTTGKWNFANGGGGKRKRIEKMYGSMGKCRRGGIGIGHAGICRKKSCGCCEYLKRKWRIF